MNHHYARYFRYDQLTPRLQQVSKPFCELAHWAIRTLPDNRMSQLALEKLIEVKDAAVRSVLDDPIGAVPLPPPPPGAEPPERGQELPESYPIIRGAHDQLDGRRRGL